jgi:hypothetical protein
MSAFANFRRVGKGAREPLDVVCTGTNARAVPTCRRLPQPSRQAFSTDRGPSVFVGMRPKRAALPTLQSADEVIE